MPIVPTAAPVITSISPTSANSTINVTVNGSNSGSSQGSNIVLIADANLAAGSIVSWSNTKIVFAVPNTTPSNPTASVYVYTSMGVSNQESLSIT